VSSAIVPVYARADIAFERGDGCWLTAADGERYLDFGGGIAVASLGYSHPHLVAALTEQGAKLWHSSNLFQIPGGERLASRLTAATFADLAFFSNSGAEANEAAIKMARKRQSVGGHPERYRILTFEGAFHGRTLATIAAGGQAKYIEGFGPKVDGFDQIPITDLAAVEAAIGRWVFGATTFGNTTSAAFGWPLGAAAVGLLIAVATVLLPVRRDLREHTVASGRLAIGPLTQPRWARYGLDAVLLVAAWVVFRVTSSAGYQLVLAPEGVPTISVSYWALAGPALLWGGSTLATWRIAELMLGPGRPLLARLLRPVTGQLAGTVAATLSRQRRPLVRAITLLSLAVAFAVSTSTFNATYRRQAEVDAQLTNGADVTVTVAPGAAVNPDAQARLAGLPGVTTVEPIQHRFAYIGADLQDLYGVHPSTINHATALQDSYFPGAKADDLMRTLERQPDSVLVSAETVTDFQLQVGDPLTLRLVDRATHQLKPVVFRYVGVVTEFPTAPKDSFLVANADYVAQRTGSGAVGAYLVDTGGGDTSTVAVRLRELLGSSATVTDVVTVRDSVGSSLTAVDLAGLTRIELSFAVVLAVAAAGLVLALGFAERRRTYAILSAIGARPHHLRAFIFSDTGVLGVVGLAAGVATGSVLSIMLIRVLSGVFDPPPDTVAVPWRYLMTLAGATIAALIVVATSAVVLARRPAISALREAS